MKAPQAIIWPFTRSLIIVDYRNIIIKLGVLRYQRKYKVKSSSAINKFEMLDLKNKKWKL